MLVSLGAMNYRSRNRTQESILDFSLWDLEDYVGTLIAFIK